MGAHETYLSKRNLAQARGARTVEMSCALLALLIIPLVAPIEAGSPFGGFHGPASHHGFPVFHHCGSRSTVFWRLRLRLG